MRTISAFDKDLMKEGCRDSGAVFEQRDSLFLAFDGQRAYEDHMATYPVIDRLNAAWRLGRQHRLALVGALGLDRLSPARPMYDEVLALRHRVRQTRDWTLADAPRDFAELAYGQAITATSTARTSVWRNGSP
jgi:hypothetical protein